MRLRVTTPRLGRVESAILEMLAQQGGVCARESLLDAVFPGARPAEAPGGAAASPALATRGGPEGPQQRALAESTLSRALASLERKGLLVRDRSRTTGRTLLRSADTERLPRWERQARAEDDLAAHMTHLATVARAAAAQARRRAVVLRSGGSIPEGDVPDTPGGPIARRRPLLGLPGINS